MLLAWPAVAFAQLHGGLLDAGAWAGAGVPVRSGGRDSGRYVALQSLGYFLDPHVSIGIRLGMSGAFDESPGSEWSAVFALHGPPVGRLVPFVAAQGGAWADLWRESPQLTGTLGAQAGAKIFLSDRWSINAACVYQTAAHRLEQGYLTGLLGFSFYKDWKP